MTTVVSCDNLDVFLPSISVSGSRTLRLRVSVVLPAMRRGTGGFVTCDETYPRYQRVDCFPGADTAVPNVDAGFRWCAVMMDRCCFGVGGASFIRGFPTLLRVLVWAGRQGFGKRSG